METLSIVVNAVAVAGIGGILVWATTRLERRIEQVEEKLTRRIEGLGTGLDALRSDMTNIALAVGARPRAQDG